MESTAHNDKFVDGGVNGVVVGNSRWNPTKEQISMLENLYSQGIRTPSAEQIQQITARLKVYGHIEGKNVFYWFQNHKARQRQKQKQETMAAYAVNHCCYYNNNNNNNNYVMPNQFHQPVFLPSPANFTTNVVCSPYYAPHGDLRPATGGGMKRKPWSAEGLRLSSTIKPKPRYPSTGIRPSNSSGGIFQEGVVNNGCNHERIGDQETLPLFPLHPTGGLVRGSDAKTLSLGAAKGNSTDLEGNCYKPYFDFFSE